MKSIKHLTAILILSLGTMFSIAAQDTKVSGLLLNAGVFNPIDMMQYNRNNYSLSSARVAAMGGAFTALSGDMTAITMNPAGMAGSMWSFSAALSTNNTNNPFKSGNNTKTSFALNQIGTIMNLYTSKDYANTFNIGFTYNKLADFNHRGSMKLPANAGGSILNIFQQQLNGLYSNWKPIAESDLRRDPYNNTDIYIDEWGGVLGYQSGLFPAGTNGFYGSFGMPDNGIFTPSLKYISSGYVGEYNFAGNINLNDILSIGVSFGFQDINSQLQLSYTENYDDRYSGPAQQYLERMQYNQYVYTSGSTFNFKIGAIIKPLPFLRLGIAYHTPSYTNLYKEYSAGMGTTYYGTSGQETYNSTLVTGSNYSYNSAPRLLSGAAITIGRMMALSFDYECVWYNKMKYTSDSFAVQDNFNQAISQDYKPANNYRVGLEIKPTPKYAIRLGYAYYDSPIKEKDTVGEQLIFRNIFTTSSHLLSAGFGVWLTKKTSCDIAYVFSRANIAPYELYYYDGEAKNKQGNTIKATYSPGDIIKGATLNNHMITMSFNFHF